METYTLAALAEVHNDLDSLALAADYLKTLRPSVTLISGDWLDLAFSQEESQQYADWVKQQTLLPQLREAFCQVFLAHLAKARHTPREYEVLQKVFSPQVFQAFKEGKIGALDLAGLRNHLSQIDLGLSSALQEYIDFKSKADDEKDRGQEFLRHAESYAESQYTAMLALLDGLPFYTVPGNNDAFAVFTKVFGDHSLHKRTLTDPATGLILSGYGSARCLHPLIPPQLHLPYLEEIQETEEGLKIASEPALFLSQAAPHLALTHEYPLGLVPSASPQHAGSAGLAYCLSQSTAPSLLVCAHHHSPVLSKVHGTFVLLPGKLAHETHSAQKDTGKPRTFLEMEITKEEKEGGLKIALQRATLSALTPAVTLLAELRGSEAIQIVQKGPCNFTHTVF